MKTDRWRIALHESGHAVSAIVLGGQCDGLALYDDDSGLCQSAELLGNREAYSIAAGPAAEVLAESYPVPEVAVKESHRPTVDELLSMPLFKTAPALACQMARSADDRKHFDSDDRCLALWAIMDHEDLPDRWAQRVALAKRIAGEIVEKHAAEIVRLATALFERGALCRDEITELLTKSNEGKLT